MKEEHNEVSMSQHLFEQVSTFTGSGDVSSKIQKAKTLAPFIQQVDGFLSFSEPSHEGQLPVLEWNAHFRKAYTLLLWVRPVLGGEKETTIHEDNALHPQRLLYRFSTSHDDASGLGVCVAIGDWRVHVQNDNQEKRVLRTTLTAFSLPNSPAVSPLASMDDEAPPYVTAPIELVENEWALIGITHVFPYLKRPHWTICVNGRVKATGELIYPVLDLTPVMQFNTLFQNVVGGGAIVYNDAEDSRKTASELQTQTHLRLNLSLHLASFSLSNEALSSTIQALLAQAGPTISLQQNGALPTLPPVSNWSKGSSLEGPNVGIPMVVHGQALQLQQLASSCVLWGSAVEARLLGHSDGQRSSVQRIICRMLPRRGTTRSAPRVGLIQPTPPGGHHSRSVESGTDDNIPISLTILGSCSVHHNLSDYLLHSPDVTNVGTQLFHCTKHLSLLMEAQALDSHLLLPFFLALPPPGTLWDLQQRLYQESLQHLYDLYTNEGELAGRLLRLFSASIRTGGGRWHELVLQNGSLHILTCSLRQSLVRAEVLNVSAYPNAEAFKKAHAKTYATLSLFPNCPTKIPIVVAHACAELLDACCGPPSVLLENLSPSMQIQRTSDLALTALFGLALDLELWGRNVPACAEICEAIAERYGGPCVTAGYIVRSQISVQYLLDLTKSQLDREAPSEALERAANACAKVLQAMLLSSLSNQRSISQGEHDVGACMGALSDCPLGTLGAHIIFTALMGVLQWCEIFPPEEDIPPADDDHKMQVASRLGRNLLMCQFHDVVAPMLLSRTVFCGERTMSKDKDKNGKKSVYAGSLSWEEHWRLALLTFSWVSSIAGPEGVIASKSLGSLLLASGLAGSLQGALDTVNKDVVSNLLLPPPTMALTIAASSRQNEWSYSDLLADRLQVMMPLLPGLVVSLLSHPSDVTAETKVSVEAMDVLSELLTAVGGSFYRVFGGKTHSAGPRSSKGFSSPRKVDSKAVKAAKSYVPHLLVVVMILENHIDLRRGETGDEAVNVLSAPQFEARYGIEDASWVEVSSTLNESFISDGVVRIPAHGTDSESVQSLVARLSACQKSIMTTISELMANAMRAGGGEASTLLWRSVLSTLKESVAYAGRESKDESTNKDDKSGSSESKYRKSRAESLAYNILCRLSALVLIKSLKRDHQWEVWVPDLSSAVSRLCLLVEEKELILRPLGKEVSQGQRLYSSDQILLLSAMVDVLAYGRDTAGWCQLILPTPPLSTPRNDEGDDEDDALGVLGITTSGRRTHISGTAPDGTATSKLMLPVLQPCQRVMVECIGKLSSKARFVLPKKRGLPETEKSSAPTPEEKLLLDLVISELRESLTAAIVGLAFASARDVALQAMASLRRSMTCYKNSGDDHGFGLCSALLSSVAEEIRVRHQGERRLRETALVDAYDDEGKADDQVAKLHAAADAMEIENMILGGALIPNTEENISHEEISFDTEEAEAAPAKEKTSGGDDFVLFPDTYKDGSSRGADESRAKMQWNRYEGLGSALEECAKVSNTATGSDSTEGQRPSADAVLGILTPFLDAWDERAAVDAAESELVELFDFSLQSSPSGTESPKNDNDNAMGLQQLPILGSETAADSMSTFIEFAAVEKSRMLEVTSNFLPNHRHSVVAYTERFCWARYIEIGKDGGVGMNKLWERGIADGNRDVRSRLVSIPCTPQFKRYIPKYLDHSADHTAEHNLESDDEDAKESETGHHRRIVETESAEIDKFTKNLLKAGHVEIVDITKKEVIEEDEPEMILRSGIDLDDDDMFDDRPLEMPASEEDPPTPTKPFSDTDSMSATEATSTTEDTSRADAAEDAVLERMKLGSSHFNITTSAFASPPDNSSSTLSLIHSAAAGMIQQHVENCLHVKAEGSRKCAMLLTQTHLILEYDADTEGLYEGEMMAVYEEAERQQMIEETGGRKNGKDDERIKKELERRQRETASLRPKSIRWNLSELSHVYLRRYRLRDSSIEMFFIPSGGTSFGGYGLYSPSTSLFLDFGPGYEGKPRRDDSAFAIMKRAPPQAIKQWPDREVQFLHEQISRLTMGWVEGRITNFDYLLHLNMLSGRSYNDICQYPVMPWVLADYKSEEIPDLRDPDNFRDLRKPMGALNPKRLEDFIERFNTFADPSIPPFMYGSHYSTSAGVVLHFLVRLHPFAGLHRSLQGGHFDVADRLFSSVPRTWEMCTGSSAAEVKELTPEWYCNPSFLKNTNKFKLGTSQEGEVLGEVDLPPWAKGKPETFIEVMRNALESDICSEMLPDWIDLIFGRKQQGPESVAAHNVFFYLTYYGSVDVASIEDESLRQATELQIAHFGQCPMQLFTRPHVRRIQMQNRRRLSFYQILSAYTSGASRKDEEEEKIDVMNRVFGEPLHLPFFSAPLSHWVHLDAPPPGPHAALVSVRLAGTDRCLAVDAQGVFHCFRWAWKAEEDIVAEGTSFPIDNGCFVAQRELARFRTVPRLIHTPRPDEVPAVAISKTLFAGRSVLLVLSDGDGRGGLAMQLVDPAKGNVRGEAVVPSVHSGQITCISTDPIGTAAGHGGVGGELAIVGSSDGCASIWRFMSSHYLPLRPRVRLAGHGGAKISAVSLSASIHIAATVSSHRCCIHSIGNGHVIRIIDPPTDALDLPFDLNIDVVTTFADTAALAISVQGFIVTVCETVMSSRKDSIKDRSVISLHLFSLEGISLGTKALESWRGIPHKMSCTPDGTAVLVCSGRGVTIHRLSAITPLEFIDEWHITETDELTTSVSHAWDVDLGPSLNRPVVAAAACSSGVLRLHALAGISPYSERHKSLGIGQSVGSALARPARRLRSSMIKGFGLGQKIVSTSKEIGKEVTTDVKEKGVGGFLGGMFGRKSSN